MRNGEFRSTKAAPLGTAYAGGIPGRSGLDHRIAQARRLPQGISRLRSEEGCSFGKPDITRLLADPGIIRSRAKIEATIQGARIYEEMRRNGEDFAEFAWKLAGGKPIKNKTGQVPAKTELSEEISAALKKRGFKFVGPVIVYAWMQASGMVNDHDPRCFRRNA